MRFALTNRKEYERLENAGRMAQEEEKGGSEAPRRVRERVQERKKGGGGARVWVCELGTPLDR